MAQDLEQWRALVNMIMNLRADSQEGLSCMELAISQTLTVARSLLPTVILQKKAAAYAVDLIQLELDIL